MKTVKPVYFEPRSKFDEAIICINENNRVEYDIEIVRNILKADYIETLSSLSKYRSASQTTIANRADRLACKWIITMKESEVFGSITTKPILKANNERDQSDSE